MNESKTPFCEKFEQMAESIENYVIGLSDEELSEYLRQKLNLFIK